MNNSFKFSSDMVFRCAEALGITEEENLVLLDRIYKDGVRNGAQNTGRLSHLRGFGISKEIKRLEEEYGDEEGLIFDLYNAAHQLGLDSRKELGLAV